MRYLQDLRTLDQAVRSYGDGWQDMPTGVLAEQADALEHLGLVEGHEFVGHAGERYPLLCGEIIVIWTEDGPTDGRCGHPIAPGGNGCERHDISDLGECEHGMSLALCAGPGHYPPD